MKDTLALKVAQWKNSKGDDNGRLVIIRASNGQYMTSDKKYDEGGVSFADFVKGVRPVFKRPPTP